MTKGKRPEICKLDLPLSQYLAHREAVLLARISAIKGLIRDNDRELEIIRAARQTNTVAEPT